MPRITKVNYKGTEYDVGAIDATLTQNGQAADAKKTGDEITSLKEDLVQITGVEYLSLQNTQKYIATNGTTADITALVSDSGIDCGVYDCTDGDKFTLTGHGAVAARLWAFVKSTGEIISKSNASVAVTGLILTAPTESAYLIINARRREPFEFCKGMLIPTHFASVEQSIGSLQNTVSYQNSVVLYDDANSAVIKNFTDDSLYVAMQAARSAVPTSLRRQGLIITYKANGNTITERFIGTNVALWYSDNLWSDLKSKGIYTNPVLYAVENYIHSVICDKSLNLEMTFLWNNTSRKLTVYVGHKVNGANIWIGKIVDFVPADYATNDITDVICTKYHDDDPVITVRIYTKRLAESTFSGAFSVGSSSVPKPIDSIYVPQKEVPAFDTIKEGAESEKVGLFTVGETAVIGIGKVTTMTARNIENAYRPIVPKKLFPMIKKSQLVRKYAADNVPLYICSQSDKHIFWTICPTDTKHIDFADRDQYAADYFYYSDKSNPDNMIKVNLPHIMPGSYSSSRVGRKKFVFEMSNGNILLEVENGEGYTSWGMRNNLYVVSGVFDAPTNSEITIPSDQCTLSLGFKVGNSRISAFDQIVEAKAGTIIVAPYGAGKTARVYVTHDYGANWELIFCGDTENTSEPILVKQSQTGESYGAWPTPDTIHADTPLDWAGTYNGNIHIHGIAYDRYLERIWIATGDGYGHTDGVTGIWWTDDFGQNWYRISRAQMSTQIMGIIPMDNCVLFSTDGPGDGFWRWNRGTAVKIEECYNYLGTHTELKVEAGRAWKTKDGFWLQTFAPDNPTEGDWMNRGGLVVTYNGFYFEKVYEDEFAEIGTITSDMTTDEKQAIYQRAFETAEIGWSCNPVDCGDKILLSAQNGGYIKLDLKA